MRILHAAAELFPILRTGGLGDVVAALPPAQRRLGLDARLVLPAYPAVRAAVADLHEVGRLDGLLGVERVGILRGTVPGSLLPVYALDAPALFDRPGSPYQAPDGAEWPDNALRFGLLARAAALLARGQGDPGWQADLLHAHDWHAGLAPAYLKLLPDPGPAPASVLTVHNLAYQGLFPPESLAALGLPEAAFTIDGVEFWGRLSFLKAGLAYADRVTTVSPTYAREIATPALGAGLEGIIARRGAEVSGILNGVDDEVWDPARDPAIAERFDAGRLEHRAANRTALIARMGLASPPGPLYGVVSRLTEQKGLDLLIDALPTLVAGGGGLVLLGSGDAALEAAFAAAARARPDRIAVTVRYDDALAHRIMAGCDAVLVPSRFEPCGLVQLYALRYGAVPVVRRTGGLADTVVDAVSPAIEQGRATGILFDRPLASDLAGALERCAFLFRDAAAWRRLQRAGMRQRFDWAEAAGRYLALYRSITTAA